MSSNPTSRWAATVLAHAPTRAVADRLFALIDDGDLSLAKPPAVGITRPKEKQAAHRAEFTALSVRDDVDIDKMQRDPRIGVRRMLARNPAARIDWVDNLLVDAAARGDVDTVKYAAPAASTTALAACAGADSAGASCRFELMQRVEAGRLTAAEQVAACQTVTGSLWELHLTSSSPYSSGGRLVDVVARLGDVGVVADALPALAPALLWRAAVGRRIDAVLAQVYIRHADALDEIAAAASVARGIRTEGGGGIDADAVATLACAGSPALAGLVAVDAPLSGDYLDAVISHGGDAAVRALAANPSVTWTTAQADALASRAAAMAANPAPGTGPQAGRRDLDAAEAVFERNLPCSPEATLDLVRAANTWLFTRWVLGRYENQPRPGQVTALFDRPGRALELMSHAHHTNLIHEACVNELPWAEELRATAAPLSELHEVVQYAHAEMVATAVAPAFAALGDDPEVWATFVALAPTFPGSGPEAAMVALAVSD